MRLVCPENQRNDTPPRLRGVVPLVARVVLPRLPDALSPPMSADEMLETSIGELRRVWVVVRCGAAACGSTGLPLKLAAQRHGGGVTVAQLLARMKCKRCGGSVQHAHATKNAAAGQGGPSPTWTLDLIG